MQAELLIRLTPGKISPDFNRCQLNRVAGGPETLLEWLEKQLGLAAPAVPGADRITEYAGLLEKTDGAIFSASLQSDRWATAAELLRRRDQLALAGWQSTADESQPALVQDLARAAAIRPLQFRGEAERLQRVLDALDSGQQLPAYQCRLMDPPEFWPVLWQRVLARLDHAAADPATPHAAVGTALHAAQRRLTGADIGEASTDESLRIVQTLSASSAVELVAAVLAAEPSVLSETVICCEDDQLAARLDACLDRLGLPTTGASAPSAAHPVLQVLPLSLALCQSPVDPQALLDFLSLPVTPIPRRAASRLSQALTQEPGLGSSAWEKACEKLFEEENDPEGVLRERIGLWLHGERWESVDAIPTALVRTRAGMVAQWAASRAALLLREDDANTGMIRALQTAAGQATTLGLLAESQGTLISQPQLARLLEESASGGIDAAAFLRGDGGPIRVSSLAEISAPCRRLIWLGLATADTFGCRWSVAELSQLREAGVLLDDGQLALSALRAAEARGLCFITDTILAVSPPQDRLQRWHPVWLTIRSLLPEQAWKSPPVMEALVECADSAALSPWCFDVHEIPTQAAQPVRPLWELPRELLRPRERVSATGLQDRLGCPLKWTFNYLAGLRPGPIAELPGDHQLLGTFCHSVLERVFSGQQQLPSEADAVAAVQRTFAERLPLDAAPLDQPGQSFVKRRLEEQLVNATRSLIRTLEPGGYRITGLEVELDGEALGSELSGFIDCLAERADGSEAIIDFKYGGRSKYYSMIAEGKAVQLATYAYGRSQVTGRFPGVAYLILSDGLVYSPSGSPIEQSDPRSQIDAVAISEVWQVFATAIQEADAWLRGEVPVPARPLLPASDWPAGVELVLEPRLSRDEEQGVCRYCNYRQLCGMQETE